MKALQLFVVLFGFSLFASFHLQGSAPKVKQLLPAFGPSSGENSVEIKGKDFKRVSSVTFDSIPANFSMDKRRLLTAIVPPHVPGIVNVSVTNPDATSLETHASLYTYQGTWFAYILNYFDDQVTPFDIAAHTAETSINVGIKPETIAITPDGKTAYVTNSVSNNVIPIDIATHTVGTAIGVGYNPIGIAITPDGKTAYVANFNSNTVTPIDLATHTVGTPINAGKTPDRIAITPDGKTAYVTNYNSNTVTPIDLATHKTGKTIRVGIAPIGIAITPDGKTAYVANQSSSFVTPIDIATNTGGAQIKLVTHGDEIAITPDGKTAYVVDYFGHAVTPIDIATHTAGTPIDVGNGPEGIAITPDGKTAYVVIQFNNNITPIDIVTNTAGAPIELKNAPTDIAITPDQAPFASFTVKKARAGAATTFDASSSVSPVGSIASYAWDFGDGSTKTVTSPIVKHSYKKPGTYQVTLTVTNTAGTSTEQVFTGQTMSRNGGPLARFQKSITIKKHKHCHSESENS